MHAFNLYIHHDNKFILMVWIKGHSYKKKIQWEFYKLSYYEICLIQGKYENMQKEMNNVNTPKGHLKEFYYEMLDYRVFFSNTIFNMQ